MAAVQIEISCDGVAGLEATHARTGFDDLAGDLMADDARELDFPAAGFGMLDGQPRPAGDDAGHRLARTGHGIGPLLQFKRQIGAVQNHRLHGGSSSSAGARRSVRDRDSRAPR
jgi:hypothetical protein